jgi:hypothetical protein
MKPRTLIWCSLFWVVTMAAGTTLMLRYQNTPGSGGDAPPVWPEGSRLHYQSGRPILVMFAHPKCPCFHASLEELELMLAQNQGRVEAYVLFFKPIEAGEDWPKIVAWRTAAALKGVKVLTDEAGNEARIFGCETSGDAVFYDPEGRLRFHGGITPSRGETGDNAGRRALQEIIAGMPLSQIRTSVFGCPLSASVTKTTIPPLSLCSRPSHR